MSKSVPLFSTFSGMFAALSERRIQPGDQVACAHCPWMGSTTKFAPHLLVCPDQTATGETNG